MRDYTPHPRSGEAVLLGDERIAAGRTIVERLLSDQENPLPATAEPQDLALLREVIRANFGGFEARGVASAVEPYAHDYYVTRSIDFTPAQIAALHRVAGMVMLQSNSHGTCKDCIFSVDGRDRGWSSPCSGCGSGHPRFIAAQ